MKRLELKRTGVWRQGFTLIEIMVAAMLISVVSLALLQTHQNSTEMGHVMQKKLQYADWVLIPAFEAKLDKVKTNTRFDTLTKGFNIDQREIRETLKAKATLSLDLVERINAADMMSAIEESAPEGEDENIQPIFEGFRLEVYEQVVKMEHESYRIYRIVKP